MEGLEASEVSYDTVKADDLLRIEAEFYVSPSNIKCKTVKGIDIIDFIQYGTSDELNELKAGFPVLRLNEFDSYFVGKPSKYCSLINNNEFESLRLKQGDVLICRTNGNPKLVGRAAVVLDDTQYAYASYLFRVRPKLDLVYPEVLTVYLRGKYGREQINKFSMTGNQTNFSPAKFREISIPLLSFNIQNVITKNVKIAYSLLRQSHSIYSEAEEILLEELGLKDWKPTSEAVAIKTFADFATSGRLDAEYYQPKYDELFAKLENYNCTRLGSIVTIRKAIEPGSDAYQDTGIPFMRVSNLSKFEITQPEIHLDRAIYEELAPKPTKDTILLSKDGSVGIAYKVEKDIDAITSGAILHLNLIDNEFLPDYLTLVLNSVVIKMQAERDAGGSVIQHWKPLEIENVIIPELPIEKQKLISNKTQESFKLRTESKRLLELAKTAVEMAIEQSEDVAIDYINANLEPAKYSFRHD